MPLFKGYDWYVRRDGKGNPGNNEWRMNNVSVDAQGRLHLKVTNQGGVWTCAEFGTNEMLGYGDYIFTVENTLDYDKQIVAAGFNYLDDNNEVDIEITRWGDDNVPNGNFVVQPAPYSSANDHLFQLEEDIPNTRHVIRRHLGGISFRIETADGMVLHEWAYSGSVKPAEMQYFVFQLWLAGGKAPSNFAPAELIISDFKFIPMTGQPVPAPQPDPATSDVVRELRDELASQQKLSEIRAIVNGAGTLASKVSKIKVIV